MNAILLLGSDLGDREKYLNQAITYVGKEVGEIIKTGNILETAPVGFTSDTMFLNQLIEVKTALSPMILLQTIKEIEAKIGRVYTKPLPNERYVSRVIDIDILKIEGLIFDATSLMIPHNQVDTRKFVQELLDLF